MNRMRYVGYALAFVVACAIGLGATYTETRAHGAGSKVALAVVWVAAVVAWTTVVFFAPDWLKKRAG